jgi:hypothetical protein
VDVGIDPYNIESTSNPVLKNLIELFKGNSNHKLIIHTWLSNPEFQDLIKEMDFGMQLSYTESFNIVASDFVNNNKLILVSNAIDWLPAISKTSTINYDKTIRSLIFTYLNRNNFLLKKMNLIYLKKFNRLSKTEWLNFML